nr:unnamed protein product [Callosobruchus analis]
MDIMKLSTNEIAMYNESVEKWSCEKCFTALKRSRYHSSGTLSSGSHEKSIKTISSASAKPLITEHFDQLMAELGKVALSQSGLAMEVAGVRAAQEEFTMDLHAIKTNLTTQGEHIAKHKTLITDIQAKLKSLTDSHNTVEKDFAKVSQDAIKLKTNAVHCVSTLKKIKDAINKEKNVLVMEIAETDIMSH